MKVIAVRPDESRSKLLIARAARFEPGEQCFRRTINKVWQINNPGRFGVITDSRVSDFQRLLQRRQSFPAQADQLRCGRSEDVFERAQLRRSEEHTSELQSQSNLVCR